MHRWHTDRNSGFLGRQPKVLQGCLLVPEELLCTSCYGSMLVLFQGAHWTWTLFACRNGICLTGSAPSMKSKKTHYCLSIHHDSRCTTLIWKASLCSPPTTVRNSSRIFVHFIPFYVSSSKTIFLLSLHTTESLTCIPYEKPLVSETEEKQVALIPSIRS